MFLRHADFTPMPQFADLLHRRTNEAVNYFRQRFAFQIRGDKNAGCRFFASVNQRLKKCRIRIVFFITSAVVVFITDSSPWLCFNPRPCSRWNALLLRAKPPWPPLVRSDLKSASSHRLRSRRWRGTTGHLYWVKPFMSAIFILYVNKVFPTLEARKKVFFRYTIYNTQNAQIAQTNLEIKLSV